MCALTRCHESLHDLLQPGVSIKFYYWFMASAGDGDTQALSDREVAVYSISCRKQNNIDLTIAWLSKHAR
jgi:hypothetical protein